MEFNNPFLILVGSSGDKKPANMVLSTANDDIRRKWSWLFGGCVLLMIRSYTTCLRRGEGMCLMQVKPAETWNREDVLRTVIGSFQASSHSLSVEHRIDTCSLMYLWFIDLWFPFSGNRTNSLTGTCSIFFLGKFESVKMINQWLSAPSEDRSWIVKTCGAILRGMDIHTHHLQYIWYEYIHIYYSVFICVYIYIHIFCAYIYIRINVRTRISILTSLYVYRLWEDGTGPWICCLCRGVGELRKQRQWRGGCLDWDITDLLPHIIHIIIFLWF